MKIMSIMAHQDDFEFNAGGAFALSRKHYGDKLAIKIVATTRGASGHHAMTLEETFARRHEEAKRSASILDAEYECLRQLDGSHLPGQVFIDSNFLGGLWNCIRNLRRGYRTLRVFHTSCLSINSINRRAIVFSAVHF